MEIYQDFVEFVKLLKENGVAPVRIDILKEISGLKFGEAYKHRLEVKWATIEKVNFISLQDLIENKKHSGRDKDMEDIRWIEKYSRKKIK